MKLSILALAAILLVNARLPGKAPPVVSGAQAASPAIEGASIGAKVAGAPFAVWADSDNDGLVDGYVANGAYVPGTPPGYQPALGRVAASGSPNVGAEQPAPAPVASGPLKGAVIGAPVAGKPGAVWGDINADGQVDGYVYKGQYYSGAPRRASKHP